MGIESWIVLIIVGVGANILHKQGIPFSMHPIKPDFKKINPGEGLKKMFKRRNAAEFGVSALRLFIWFTASIILVWFFFESIMASALCDNGCLLNEAFRIVIVSFQRAVDNALGPIPMGISANPHTALAWIREDLPFGGSLF